MSKFFGSVNEVNSHKKPMQSDLALEIFWFTQRGWIQLRKTVATGMNITNFWKLFWYEVKRDHYEKSIDIRPFLEQITFDCFNNNFSNDTGTPENNIPSLDEVYEGDTVSTC